MPETALFTPSDIVLLRAGELATDLVSGSHGTTSRVFYGQGYLAQVRCGTGVRLFEDQGEWPDEAWAMAMLATAFLALADHGIITLEERTLSRWGGLSHRSGLVAVLAEPEQRAPDPWPDKSVERRLRIKDGGQEVSEVVKDFIAVQSDTPARDALEKGRACLAERGLLDERITTRFFLFSQSHYFIPDQTREQVPSPDVVTSLIDACRQDRPETWDALNEEIWAGIDARVDRSSQYEVLVDD